MSTNIYITDEVIRVAQTRATGSNIRIVKDCALELASLKKQELPSRFKAFLKENKISSESITLLIPRNRVSIRYLELPSVDRKEINKMIEYEVDSLFPHSPEELVFGETIIEVSQGYSRVMLVVFEKQIISGDILLLRQAGLVPDFITVSTISLFNQARKQQKRGGGNYLLVNSENNLLDILVIHKNKPIFSSGTSLGAQGQQAKVSDEIAKVLNMQEVKGYAVEKIVVSGTFTETDSLCKEIEQVFARGVVFEKRISVVKVSDLRPKQGALEINLLPRELRRQKQAAKRRRSILYFTTLLILNLSLVANMIFMKLKNEQRYIVSIQEEIKKIENHALLLRQKMLKTQIFNSYYHSGRIASVVLAELYRIAPEALGVTSLELRGESPSGVLVLTGQAKDTDAVWKFATLIKKSTLIQKADVNTIKKRKYLSREIVDFEIRCVF